MTTNNTKFGIQGRFIVGSIGLLTLIIAVISVIQLYNFHTTSESVLKQSARDTRASLLIQAHKRGKSILDYLSRSLINPVYQFDMDATYNLLKPAIMNDEVISVIVFDKNGMVFHDGDDAIPTYGTLIENQPLIETVLLHKQTYSFFDNHQLTLAQPIFISDDVLGGIILTLTLDPIQKDIETITSNIVQASELGQKNLKVALIVTALASGLMGIVIAIILSRSLVAPILDLVIHTKKIVKGDYESENQIERDDEIGELAQAFNEMGRSIKRQTQEISFLAYHDSLTKLPNRNMFIARLARTIKRKKVGEAFSVMFLDLDEFKFVNDNYGHEAGDLLLCEVARRLTDNLRGSDFFVDHVETSAEFVARIGGDEFLICLPEIDSNVSAAKVAQRLIKAIQAPISLDQEEIIIAGSIGIANYPSDGVSAEELIKNADIAMYQAKNMGKNTFANFDQELNLQVKVRMEIEQDLRKAIDGEMKQFELFYQPQFAFGSLDLIGAEALIRWHHPTKGLITPDRFIQVAEECGLILPIGEWVIDTVCKQLKMWQEFYSESFHIAINLSARQVYRSSVTEFLNRALKMHALSPDRLHVEVTESILLKDEACAKTVLDDIRGLGIQLWLDDFGTGYSSLSYLRTFEFDGVKIDRSFVSDIEIDNFDRALTSAVIDMAQSLDISVVAEGVESELQADFLAEKQCYAGQGYFFSRPVSHNEFEKRFFSSHELNKMASS